MRIRNLMVVGFTIGTFSLFAKQPTVAVLALAPWLLLVPLHRNLTEQETRRDEEKKKRGDKVECQPVGPEAPKDQVGWMVLKTSGLDEQRSAAVGQLKVASGIYDVSKALAKRADRYFFKPPSIENESSKLVRSLVPLCWIVGAWLGFDRELGRLLRSSRSRRCRCCSRTAGSRATTCRQSTHSRTHNASPLI